MADKVLADALQLLGAQITFREEADALAFAAAVAEIAGEAPAAGGDLDDLTKAELVERAEAAGIEVAASDTKAEILAKLEEGSA